MRMRISWAVAAAWQVSRGLAGNVIDLGGAGWTLRDSNNSISVPAHVPSQQYLDLQNAGVIGDALFGFNDTDEAWVQRSNWTYTSPTLQHLRAVPGVRTWLVFEGLDTFAQITLCNQTVANTDNMFVQYTFDVTNILAHCSTEPKLSINFGSATVITHELSTGQLADGSDNFADSCNPSNEFGCKVYSRKQQSDFGWDWSPALVPAGPWQSIYAVQTDILEPVYVTNALIDVYRKGQMNNLPPDQSQPWVFNASIDFIGTLPPFSSLRMTLKDAANREVLQTDLEGVYHSANTITGSVIIDPAKVELWWPNGMGSQALYTATISVVEFGFREVTSVERRIGFRTIVLNLNPISPEQTAQGIAPGANWHFEINGHEMYAKGANLVPPDTFWPRVNQTKMENLFQSVQEANMNMLRVWSSGAYLPDYIYDLADEMGILLWSEFEFSDAEYPVNPTYEANYEAEAYYNVRRLNHHPSLALWAGGNELEAIILAYFFSATDPGQLQREYEHTFLEVLVKCVYANSRSISYIPSSTYHGWLSLDFDAVMPQVPRYLNSSGPDALYADTDVYNYDAATAFNLSVYPVGRFADEFGFISMPSLEMWKTAVAPEDWYLDSPTVVHHCRHTPFGATGSQEQLQLAGLEEMAAAVPLWYPVPQATNQLANFTAWIYSSQVFQADYYRSQIAFYRRGSGMPERQLGVLYWQLNDLWAAPTWASIDAQNRQKALYYTAKDIYQPVIAWSYYNASTHDLQVWATSDLWQSVSGQVKYEWFNWAGDSINLGQTSPIDFTIGAINSTKVIEVPDLAATFTKANGNITDAVLRVELETSDGQHSHVSYFHPSPIKDAPLQDPGLTLTHEGGSTFRITATKALASWVWLEYTTNAVTGRWTENAFWLNKGESKTVEFNVWDDWSNGAWVDTVTVRSTRAVRIKWRVACAKTHAAAISERPTFLGATIQQSPSLPSFHLTVYICTIAAMSFLRAATLRSLARASTPARLPSRILTLNTRAGFAISKCFLHQTSVWSSEDIGAPGSPIIRNVLGKAPERSQENDEVAAPQKQIFIGQLPYSSTPESVVEVFKQFGDVETSHALKTQSGMSRGAMFITFAEAEAADRAIKEMDQQDFGGRRIHVAKAQSRPRYPSYAPKSPASSLHLPREPTNSLFIGNMSYNMTDRDLNKIFGQVKNCVDVRVAIDRRTGQPRGFAHADFTDVDAAAEAKAWLDTQVVHGRRFRTSYAVPKRVADTRRSGLTGEDGEPFEYSQDESSASDEQFGESKAR